MKLHVLIRSLEDAQPRLTYQLLQKACQAQDVELIPIEQEKLVFDSGSKLMIQDGEAFYRLSTGPAQILAEQLLVRPGLSTIYEPWRLPLESSTWEDTLLMIEKGLPIIDTTFLFAFGSKQEIDSAVEKTGGYPVVVKYTGLSHGQGVFLCQDSRDLERVIAGYDKKKYAQLALRRFIDGAAHLRVVVVDAQAADTIKYHQPADDFRTNAAAVPKASPYASSPEIDKLAVSAAKAYGVKMAGVDILVGQDGKAWVAEVNNPCNFGRNYLTNGKNLAEDLVRMLCQ